MSNGLSQDEINALLQGELSVIDNAAASDTNSGGMMSQAELDALLAEVGAPSAESAPVALSKQDFTGVLTPSEADALGEIGNISMGTAATTLFSLLNNKVDITTPRVSVTNMGEMARQYPMPFVSVEVQYTVGLQGTNCLFLHENDVKIITDLMLGGDGTNVAGELNDMHLSCIAEVMNQLVGSSSTSLAQMLSMPIDISPPKATQVVLEGGLGYPFDDIDRPVVRIGFDMVVEGLINSEIMQVMPVDFAKSMVAKVMGMGGDPEPAPASKPAPPPVQTPPPGPVQQQAPMPAPVPMPDPYAAQQPMMQQPPPYGYPAYPYPPQPYGGYPPPYPAQPVQQQQPVDVRPATFANFGDPMASAGMGENMDILLDVPLSVSVELGKSRKYIKEILDFNVGTIVVLDKMAGELVDVIVNGKLIAQGEVVIIDDNYGCRITEIVSPSKRINPAK
ncbi:MAG: flagellar motor switch phosphatase FliY [Oscillospiraceae bacterium]|jgi:flagellar motor switch protein FliN/FliY|nr:flagellar motor switch phosphatase FliY [Oscillospiraceae bacterium]